MSTLDFAERLLFQMCISNCNIFLHSFILPDKLSRISVYIQKNLNYYLLPQLGKSCINIHDCVQLIRAFVILIYLIKSE